MARVDGLEDGHAPVREVRLEDGGLIIYDPEKEAAWIQADSPIVLSEPEHAE